LKKITGAVLYLRVNSFDEVSATEEQINSLRQLFPACPIYTLVSPIHEARDIILNDARFDKVLEYPNASSIKRNRSAFGLRTFLAQHGVGTVVISYGSAPDKDYSKLILASILFPGHRVFLFPNLRLVSYLDREVRPLFLQSIGRIIQQNYIRAGEAITERRVRFILCRAKYQLLEDNSSASPKAILWIRLDRIGDLVMSLPALLALRRRFPNARIDVVTQSPNLPLFENVEGIDHVYAYDDSTHRNRGESKTGLLDYIRLVATLRKAKFDWVIDSRGDDAARRLAYATGVTVRIGQFPSIYEFNPASVWGLLMNYPVKLEALRHASDNSLQVLRNAGIEADRQGNLLTIKDEKLAEMVTVLQEMGVKSKFAVVHASSRDRLRMWLPDRMAAVIDHLVEQHDLFVVITGATADKDDNNEICKYVRNSDCIVNAAGAFSLEQLPALMTIARLLVTVDTGPMHIAATVSTPIVALFRPIYADMHYPFNQANNVVIANESLYEADSGELPLSNISIEAVKTKIDDLMRISEDNRNPNSREANSNAK